MKTTIFLCISVFSYAQFTITNYKTKLVNTYSIDKVVDNQFQESYRVTNIYDLSSQQVDVTKVNKTYNINLYETNKSSKQEEYYNPYLKVRSSFEKRKRKVHKSIYDEFEY
jgi:hypothetical protein